jgi:hypothetical protein
MQGPKLAAVVAALVAALGSPAIIVAAADPDSGQSSLRGGDGPAATPTTVRVRGTIEHYDTGTKRLSVSTAAGAVEFVVPTKVHVVRRGITIDPSELEHLTGSGVMVRYYPSADGQVIVKSIHVFATADASRP